MPHTTLNTYLTETGLAQAQEIVASVTALGHRVLRNGLALVIGGIGMMKFTGYEARGIEPLVAQPLLAWMYQIS